jgi:O-antigen/teichoic acid export membrane protein
MAAARRMLSSDFVRHGLLVFASTMFVNVAGFALHVMVSRKIGVAGYGSFTALTSGIFLTILPSTILSTIAAKYAAEFRVLDDVLHLKALVRGIAFYVTGGAIAIALVGFAIAHAIGTYLRIDDAISIDLTLAILCLNFVLPVARGVFQGVEDFTGFSISIGVEALFRTGLATVFAFAGFGLRGVLVGWLIGSTISLVYTLAVLLKRYDPASDGKLFLDFRRLVGTTLLAGSGTLITTSLGNTDVVLVKHFFDPQAAGLYGAVSFAAKMLLLVVNFVPTIVLPKATSRSNAGGDPLPILFQALAIVGVLAGSGLVVFYFFPTFIVTTLAGNAFAAGGPLVFSYALAMVLLAALNVVVTFKMGAHRFDFIVPLVLCALGEIVAIALRHQTLAGVVQILIVGNALGLAASFYRIDASKSRRHARAATHGAAA